MNDINGDELQFVVNHYKGGHLKANKAWKDFLKKTGIIRKISFRRILVAASISFAVIIAIAATIIVPHVNNMINEDNANSIVSDTLSNSVKRDSIKRDSVIVFHFDNTPINISLKEISTHYGIKLAADDTTKMVSGEFESHNVDEAISMLEATLNIKIIKE